MRAFTTLKPFADRSLAEHAAVKKKASSTAEDQRNLRKHILPTPGRRKVTEIARADIARFHAAMKDRPTAANRCLALL